MFACPHRSFAAEGIVLAVLDVQETIVVLVLVIDILDAQV
jgi:hypothetical protein